MKTTPMKENLTTIKTDHRTPALIFFGLSIPVLLFSALTRIHHLEQSFAYKEEVRIATEKEQLYNKSCGDLRKAHLSTVSKLEESTGVSGYQMKMVYESGFKDNPIYKSGEVIVIANKAAEVGCADALIELAKIKRGSSTNFIVSNFFGLANNGK